MRNPLENNHDESIWIGAIAAGIIAAVLLIYVYLKDDTDEYDDYDVIIADVDYDTPYVPQKTKPAVRELHPVMAN